jgi:D123
MSDDFFGELNATFASLTFDKVYPLVAEHTFKTVQVPLSPDESRALLASCRHSQSAEQHIILTKLGGKIDAAISSAHFSGSGFFGKLSDFSPKDALDDTSERFMANYALHMKALQDSDNAQLNNASLQSLIWAKSRELIVASGKELLQLFARSERIADELERKLECCAAPQDDSCAAVLREWVDLDPAFEFRGFVSDNRLVALSQMATMGVGPPRYGQVHAMRAFLERDAVRFYDEALRERLAPIGAANDGAFVCDLYFHVATKRWHVVELNPWATSAAGHLFAGDMMSLRERGRQFELRLVDETPAGVFDEPHLPDSWRRILIDSNDTWFERSPESAVAAASSPSSSTSVASCKHACVRHFDDAAEAIEGVGGDNAGAARANAAADIGRSSAALFDAVKAGRATFDAYQGDWQELIGEAGQHDMLELLLEWRERLEGPDDGATMRGDLSKATRAGWSPAAAAAAVAARNDSSTWPGYLSYSFEVEGDSLMITSFYRCTDEGVTDESWLRSTFVERYARIKRSWSYLKRRIDSAPPLHWMSRQMANEDAGFVWETPMSGKTPGYTIDLDYARRQLFAVEESGLSLADRHSDSGMQGHVSFSLGGAAPAHLDQLFAFMVHLDDMLFLQSFDRSVWDHCNNLWTRDDADAVMGAARSSLDELAALVTKGIGGPQPMPSPRVKHKHIGLRGIDVYKQRHRFGFEVRRGHRDARELGDTMALIADTIEQIGADGDPLVRLYGSLEWSRRSYRYRLSAVVDWVSAGGRVAVAEPRVALEHAGVSIERVIAVVDHWHRKCVSWQDHLLKAKALLYGASPTTVSADAEYREHALTMILRRLAFLLCTDWRRFPAAAAANRCDHSPLTAGIEHTLHNCHLEQQFLIDEINAHSLADAGQDEDAQQRARLHLATVRIRIDEFAHRLSRLY